MCDCCRELRDLRVLLNANDSAQAAETVRALLADRARLDWLESEARIEEVTIDHGLMVHTTMLPSGERSVFPFSSLFGSNADEIRVMATEDTGLGPTLRAAIDEVRLA